MNQNETVENTSPEAKPEAGKSAEFKESDTDLFEGATILEEPKTGSFVHALQTFVNWVNSFLK
jgi:hypothetical protein